MLALKSWLHWVVINFLFHLPAFAQLNEVTWYSQLSLHLVVRVAAMSIPEMEVWMGMAKRKSYLGSW